VHRYDPERYPTPQEDTLLPPTLAGLQPGQRAAGSGGGQAETAPAVSVGSQYPGCGHRRYPPGQRLPRGHSTHAAPAPYAQESEAGSDAFEQAPVVGSVNSPNEQTATTIWVVLEPSDALTQPKYWIAEVWAILFYAICKVTCTQSPYGASMQIRCAAYGSAI
jgi:hypothetical protein